MKIIVTGGTGFIGRHIVWRLSNTGHQVVFTGRNASAAQLIIELSHTANKPQWLALNHCEPNAEKRLCLAAKNAQAAIHCAGLSSPWGSKLAFKQANLDSTQQIIAAAEFNGLERLVNISTPSVYFQYKDRFNIREDEPRAAPVNAYANSKALAEHAISECRLPYKISLRPRAVFGPWDNTLLPRLLRVMQAGAIPTPRDGMAYTDLTYIDNLVDVVELALTKPLVSAASIFNVSNGQPLRIKELLHTLAREFNLTLKTRNLPWPLLYIIASAAEASYGLLGLGEPPITRYSAGVMTFSQTLSLDKLQSALGYQPQVDIHDGIARYAYWFKGQRA